MLSLASFRFLLYMYVLVCMLPIYDTPHGSSHHSFLLACASTLLFVLFVSTLFLSFVRLSLERSFPLFSSVRSLSSVRFRSLSIVRFHSLCSGPFPRSLSLPSLLRRRHPIHPFDHRTMDRRRPPACRLYAPFALFSAMSFSG